ncbi:hypothetical protein DRN85_03625 [Methanosarcinales archaeon]|nr:MAG: hypothetical protein DRN85_03625 [Methanosarcinales archaeon]
MGAATWNPADKSAGIDLYDGDLRAKRNTEYGNSDRSVRANVHFSSGKWYWEYYINDRTNSYHFGIAEGDCDLESGLGRVEGENSYGWRVVGGGTSSNNRLYHNGEELQDYNPGADDGDIVMVALDLDNGKIWYGVNGVWCESGNPETGANPAFSGISGDFYPALSLHWYDEVTAIFKASDFHYTPPTGFQPVTAAGIVQVIDLAEGGSVGDEFSTSMGYTKTVEEEAAVSDEYKVPAPAYMTFAEAATVAERYDVPSPVYTEVTEVSSVEDAYAAFNLTATVVEEATGLDEYATNLGFTTGEDQSLVEDHWEFIVERKASPVNSYIGHVASSPTTDVTKAPITGDATVDIVADVAGLGGAVLSEGIEVSCKATASQVVVGQGVASAALGAEALGAGFAEATAEVNVDATGCVSTLGSAVAELLLSVSGEASAEIRGQSDASIVSHVDAAGHSDSVAEGQVDVIVGLKAMGVVGKLACGECTLRLATEGSGAPVPTGKAEASLGLGLQAFARTNIGVCVLRYTR